MKTNSRIVGAVLMGVGTWVIARYVQNAMQQQKKLVTKKFHREALQEWEGEGGNIIDPVRRSPAG